MFANEGICYVVGSVDIGSYKLNKREHDFVIAADYGYKNVLKSGVAADLIVGDFDSLKTKLIPENTAKIIVFPAEKDDTDMMIGIKEGFNRGFKRFILLGGLGGEFFDHSFANMQALLYIFDNGGVGYLVDEKLTITAFCNSQLQLPLGFHGRFSVFSADRISEGVSITNAKYPLDNVKLSSAFPLGVSNFAPNSNVCVTVKTGSLWVVFSAFCPVETLNLPKYL